jgi:hypothetical protein
MTHPQSSDPSHIQFDSLCADVEDYEPLPELVPGPADTTPMLAAQEHEQAIDAEILAGLVSP